MRSILVKTETKKLIDAFCVLNKKYKVEIPEIEKKLMTLFRNFTFNNFQNPFGPFSQNF